MQDIERLKGSPNLRVTAGPENRTIFLGMDVGSAQLRSSDVKGKNPFADVRVRQAVNMAINREAIQRVVMRGQSVPAGAIVPPFVNGYSKELDALPTVDVDARRRRCSPRPAIRTASRSALHCPNDRYLNDEAICQAAVGMLGQIGIKVNLVSQSKSLHFPLIQKAEVRLLPARLGRADLRQRVHLQLPLPHPRRDKFGSWNATRYSNPEVDKLIESLSAETDIAKRNADDRADLGASCSPTRSTSRSITRCWRTR